MKTQSDNLMFFIFEIYFSDSEILYIFVKVMTNDRTTAMIT